MKRNKFAAVILTACLLAGKRRYHDDYYLNNGRTEEETSEAFLTGFEEHEYRLEINAPSRAGMTFSRYCFVFG